jgi:hypothetical protein
MRGTSEDGRLRIGGWVHWPGTTPDEQLTAELPAGDAPTAELAGGPDWRTSGDPWEADPWPSDPADGTWSDHAPGADAEAAGYQGRRRRARRPGVTGRRAALAALAVGGLLVATSVLAQQLGPGPTPPPLPAPPTPPLRLAPSPDGTPDRLGTPPTGARSPAPSSDRPPVLAGSYEAEAAEPGSHGQVTSLAGASGGQVVRLSGNRSGTFVQFTGVTVGTPGRYRLTVFYATEQRRTGTIVVNDGPPASVTFPSTVAAGGIGSVSVPVELTGGGNTIWIGSAGGAPLSLDQITLST